MSPELKTLGALQRAATSPYVGVLALHDAYRALPREHVASLQKKGFWYVLSATQGNITEAGCTALRVAREADEMLASRAIAALNAMASAPAMHALTREAFVCQVETWVTACVPEFNHLAFHARHLKLKDCAFTNLRDDVEAEWGRAVVTDAIAIIAAVTLEGEGAR